MSDIARPNRQGRNSAMEATVVARGKYVSAVVDWDTLPRTGIAQHVVKHANSAVGWGTSRLDVLSCQEAICTSTNEVMSEMEDSVVHMEETISIASVAGIQTQIT